MSFGNWQQRGRGNFSQGFGCGHYYHDYYPYYPGYSYQGDYNAPYPGDYNALYQGDYNALYQGDYNARYQGDYNALYQGDYNARYQGDYNALYQGDYNALFVEIPSCFIIYTLWVHGLSLGKKIVCHMYQIDHRKIRWQHVNFTVTLREPKLYLL